MKENQTENKIIKNPASRLLVVSENKELSLHLKEQLEISTLRSPLKVDFCYTSYNKAPQQMIEIGATEINVKLEETVNRIINDYDLVFSLHCKQIFPKKLVESVRCINFHPGLNPYNRGWYPQAFSIVNGLPIGSTIHVMDSRIDNGQIIANKEVTIELSDTSLEVYRKVIAAEKSLITENISDIINGTYNTQNPTSTGNYNGIGDYNKMCQLNLESVGKLRDHINLLRATTHGGFNNAYFTDENGSRYYVKISIEKENK